MTPDNPPPPKNRNGKGDTIELKGRWRFPVDADFVRDSRISISARLLYLLLQSYVGPASPMPFPSLGTLSKNLACHRESVQKHLTELETWGLIIRYRVKDRGRFHSTRYELKPHRRGKKPLRSKTATKSSHTIALKLVRKTPDPVSPNVEPFRPKIEHHPEGCPCIPCRRIRQAGR